MPVYRRYKKDSPVSYALGITLTFELLQQKKEYVSKVYVHSDMKEGDASRRLYRLCEEAGIPVQQSDKIFHVLSQKENCYVIGEFQKYEQKLDKTRSHIVLVSPSNAGNMGTIMRSALGFELAQMAIIRPAVDAFDPKVVRASMGAVFSVSFQYFDSFKEYQERFGERAIYPFMLQAEMSLEQVCPSVPYSLVFGNEATGLPEDFLEIGSSVIIPHSEKIDSLNLPVAASIAMYEFHKGGHKNGKN